MNKFLFGIQREVLNLTENHPLVTKYAQLCQMRGKTGGCMLLAMGKHHFASASKIQEAKHQGEQHESSKDSTAFRLFLSSSQSSNSRVHELHGGAP